MKKIFYTCSAAALALPSFVFGQATMGGSGATMGQPGTLKNPLGNIGNDLPSFVKAVIDNIIIPVGATACVVAIIYSGFLFVKAQGDPKGLEEAKTTFFWSVVGTLVLLGAATIASVVQSTINQLK